MTGTFALEGVCGVYTEIQPGSYVFMDGEYSAIEQCTPAAVKTADATNVTIETSSPFKQSLFVVCTVVSDWDVHPGSADQPHSGWIVVDAGSKAIHPGSVDIQIAGNCVSELGAQLPRLTYRCGESTTTNNTLTFSPHNFDQKLVLDI